MRGLKRGLAKRRPLDTVAVASLYAACRERGVPTTLHDVAAASGRSRKEIAACYRLLFASLNIEVPVVGAAEYVAKVASVAKAGARVQARALGILLRAEKAGLAAGTNPIGLAASALYMASMLEGENLTQEVAAYAAGVREATLRSECRRLRKVLGE